MRRPSRRASKGRASVGVRAVRRRRPRGGEQGGQVGGLVVDHVVDAVRGRRGIEQAGDGLGDVGAVADRHALGRRETAHHRDRLRDVRIAVAVDEREPQHAESKRVRETFVRQRQEEALAPRLLTGYAAVGAHGKPQSQRRSFAHWSMVQRDPQPQATRMRVAGSPLWPATTGSRAPRLRSTRRTAAAALPTVLAKHERPRPTERVEVRDEVGELILRERRCDAMQITPAAGTEAVGERGGAAVM